MTFREYYDYVTNENFLKKDFKAINNLKKYHWEIKSLFINIFIELKLFINY